jgi:hypothetical protein
MLVVHGRCGTGEVEDAVDLYIKREGDVMAHQLEIRAAEEMRDVGPGTGEEVVDAQNVVASRHEAIAQVRTQEAGTASDECFVHVVIGFRHAK